MKNDNKTLGTGSTGSNPYYLNTSSSAKDIPTLNITKPINDYIDRINCFNNINNVSLNNKVIKIKTTLINKTPKG